MKFFKSRTGAAVNNTFLREFKTFPTEGFGMLIRLMSMRRKVYQGWGLVTSPKFIDDLGNLYLRGNKVNCYSDRRDNYIERRRPIEIRIQHALPPIPHDDLLKRSLVKKYWTSYQLLDTWNVYTLNLTLQLQTD